MYLGRLASGKELSWLRNIIILVLQLTSVESFYRQADWYYAPYLPQIEMKHAPTMYTTEKPRDIPGSDALVSDPLITPDFRIEEPPYTRYYDRSFFEEERPYRIFPLYKQIYRFGLPNYFMLGCACCTVYKRLTPISACAVITSKHIITTATSTELILRRYRHFKYLQNILGFWYDTDVNSYNSSMYASVSRIHYHPKYIRPDMVNRTHPFPVVFDIAVWTATYRFYSSFFGSQVCICPRAGSHRFEHSSAVPTMDTGREHYSLIAGYQFMLAFHRVPMPWFKYFVQTKKNVYPCPKVEWGWFHCIRGNWAKLGLDSGAPLYRNMKYGWRYSGLMGMNVVSMRFRSYDMMHYFQVLESHPVLDFLYDAFNGYLPYEYLDFRFYNTQHRSPAPKHNDWICYNNYDWGRDKYYGNIPNY